MGRSLRWFGLIGGCLLVTGVAFAAPPPPEDCDNGIDDDMDFAIDCGDSNCTSDPACDFGSGCCILTVCRYDGTAGGGAGPRPEEAAVSCFEDFTQSQCESQFSGAQEAGGGASAMTECPALELVEGKCSAQPACPGFGVGPVPVLSQVGVVMLALLLAAGGALYLRRRGA